MAEDMQCLILLPFKGGIF